ncbi:MAG: STAS domain-containing protein [Nocardioidaceae bacterium]
MARRRFGSRSGTRPARVEPRVSVTSSRSATRAADGGRAHVTQVLRIEGELTARTRSQCRGRLREHLPQAPDRLVIDLRAAAPVDLVGIAVVVRLARVVRSLGSQALVVNASPTAEQALGVLGSGGLLARRSG